MSADEGRSLEPEWVRWARKLHAIAQTGLHFSEIEYDRDRYRQIDRVAAEIMTNYSDANLEQVTAFFAKDAGYATPKVDVRGAAFRDGKILMVRERMDGLWTLPGGWADVNDAPAEAAEREVWEEAGFRVKARKLAMALDKSRHFSDPEPSHTYKLFFLCEILSGEATTSFETTEVDFFAENALPPLSRGRATESQILRLFEHNRQLDIQTDFD